MNSSRTPGAGLMAAAVMLMSLMAGTAKASDDQAIEHLLNAVGSSGCLFVRNGTEHDADEAEQHLRMKYRRGRRYVDSAEQFIDRIASKSSWSGRSYEVACPDARTVPSADWLQRQLEQYREAESG